jgi:glycosyltransferase 2 family protein
MIWLKRLIALAAFAVLLYLFWPLVGELRKASPMFRQARWGWLGMAVAIQVVSYAGLAELNRRLLQPFNGRIGLFRMMAILPAFAFIEVAIPSAGASGVVLRVRYLEQSGYTPEASVFTLALESLYLGVIMTAASLLGLGYLLGSQQLSSTQVLLFGLFVFSLLALLALAVWAGRKRERVRRVAMASAHCWNRLAVRLRRSPLADELVDQRVDSFYDGLSNYTLKPLWLAFVFTLMRVVLDVASLGACFIAFNYVVPLGILLTGYGLMLALSSLSALPGGLGMADLSLAVVYARLGAPGAVAVAAALAYRLIAFWLLRFIGFVTWQVLEARYKPKG